MKNLGTPILLFFVALTCILFYQSKSDPSILIAKVYLSLGQITGLLGTVLLAFSFILAIRVPLIERFFGGLDIVYKIHHIVGAISFILLLHHPLFIIVDRMPSVIAIQSLIIPGLHFGNTLGMLALFIMIMLMIVTLYVDLPYHVWKNTHNFMGLVILLGSVHAIVIGSDMGRFLPLKILILALCFLACLAYILRRFFPRIITPTYQYRLKALTRNGDVLTLALTAVGKIMPYSPGQYAFVRVMTPELKHEEHPFSIVSIPSDPDLVFGIKILGDFTLKLENILVNTTLEVAGPFGSFGERVLRKNLPTVCVAGGIGVTPFVSLWRYLTSQESQKDRQLSLYHTAKTDDDRIYGQFMTPTTSPVHCYVAYDSKTSGRLTMQSVLPKTYDPKSLLVLLCGPIPMMRSLASQCSTLGIPKKNVIFEEFSFK